MSKRFKGVFKRLNKGWVVIILEKGVKGLKGVVKLSRRQALLTESTNIFSSIHST